MSRGEVGPICHFTELDAELRHATYFLKAYRSWRQALLRRGTPSLEDHEETDEKRKGAEADDPSAE
jgi:hypothetical protein